MIWQYCGGTCDLVDTAVIAFFASASLVTVAYATPLVSSLIFMRFLLPLNRRELTQCRRLSNDRAQGVGLTGLPINDALYHEPPSGLAPLPA